MRCKLSFWVALLGVLFLPWPGNAATVRGTVTDASRAVIVGARVTIRDEGSGVTRDPRQVQFGVKLTF